MLKGADNEVFKNIDIEPKDIKCGLNNSPVTAGKMLRYDFKKYCKVNDIGHFSVRPTYRKDSDIKSSDKNL